MIDGISSALKVAASGLEAQSTRLRVVSENIANARSTGDTPGSDPYRRKTVSFTSELDRLTGTSLVGVKSVGLDRSEFKSEYDLNAGCMDTRHMLLTPGSIHENYLGTRGEIQEHNPQPTGIQKDKVSRV